MEYKWANFLTGTFTSPVIKINNEIDLKNLQKLAEQNKLTNYEKFLKFNYEKCLDSLKKHSSKYNEEEFYKGTEGGKSFVVAYYRHFNKGFTFTFVNAFKSDRIIYSMSEIMEEFNLSSNN